MPLGKEQEDFTKDLNKLLTYLHNNNYNVRCGELFRTQEQQEIYYQRKLTKTKNSYHTKKLAIDLFIFKDNQWLKTKEQLQLIGDYWESLSNINKWGGNYNSFIDCVHFERRAK
ncbi:putative cysteine peptidase, peptidase M15 family [Campylobacter pinnipediorum subsp. pinnipediorum]|uniref:M15 family metallopeptidase n=1 Tax=Campylobacter pinnipediorum TaxID=1965231 RepID=UPI000994F723|nr:M15 family metallopeptidase [Campylobacter pinnipediorum]AQW84183.1 putative cysteine peptidase, peptidase M15 family [Campylobacter pinnipediorum subsp. pinnipediorum]